MSSAMRNASAVVVCVCAIPAMLWAQGDANTAWDPNAHLVAYPKSMGMTTTFEYWAGAEPAWQRGPNKMQFSGQIAVTDPAGLIGLAADTVMEVLVLDEVGEPLMIGPLSQYTPVYEPVVYTSTFWTLTGEMIHTIVPFEFSFDIVMPPPVEFPSRLSRVEWSMNALLSDTVEVIDLPFAPSEQGIEVAPGLEVFVERTSIEEDRYQYHSTILIDPTRIAYPQTHKPLSESRGGDIALLRGYLWSKTGLPETVVVEIDVLDADGVSIQNYAQDARTVGFVIGTSSQEDLTIITQTLTGSGRGAGAAAFIRYVVARDPYRQKVDFALEDVPVPSF